MVKGLYIFRLQSAQYLCQTIWGHTSGDSSITLSCNQWLRLRMIRGRCVEVVAGFTLLHSQQALPKHTLKRTSLGTYTRMLAPTSNFSQSGGPSIVETMACAFFALLRPQNGNLEAAFQGQGHGIGLVRRDVRVAFPDSQLDHCSWPYSHLFLFHQLRSPKPACRN